MAVNKKLLNILLFAGTILCLLQVWLPALFFTCDGPCHLYNARIVHDIWNNSGGAELFHRFYELHYTTDPNTFTTFALAGLLFFVKGVIAEKLFLSIYLIVSITGFLALLRRIGGGDSYWLLCVFLFPFTCAFSMGFYNYSFGIAFWFWMVWSWLRYLSQSQLKYLLVFLAFSALTFFTHLLPFVFGAFTCGALVLSWSIFTAAKGKIMKYILQRGAVLTAVMAPFVVLTFLFTSGEGGLRIELGHHGYRLVELIEFKYLINLTSSERIWALLAGLVLSGLGTVVAVKMVRSFSVQQYDGFFLSLIVGLFVYTFFPEEFMGRIIIISIRMQVFIHIIVACIIACRLPEGRLKSVGAGILCLVFLMLSMVRVYTRQKAVEAFRPHLEAGKRIKSGSTLLAFDLAPAGAMRNAPPITEKNAVFHHAAQYLAADKPLIVMDNYEANTGYFPVHWKVDVNPYVHLGPNGNIEGMPPYVDFHAYKNQTGEDVDYVLFWGFDRAWDSSVHFRTMLADIDTTYHIVYGPTGRGTLLYERNAHH